MHRVYADVQVVFAAVKRGGLRHQSDGALGCAVCKECRFRHKPLDGGGIGDRAFFSIGAHLFNGCLNAVEYAGLVYGNGAVPFFQRGAGYILAVRDACIVNENIQLAESGFCESDAFLPCRIIGHVQLEEGRVGGQLICQSASVGLIQVCNNHLGPLFDENFRRAGANALRRTCNDGNFAFQTIHACNFLSEWYNKFILYSAAFGCGWIL